MPLYDFICESCGQEFDELRVTGDFNAECPVCSGSTRNVIAASGFVVNGSTNRSIDTVIGEDANKKWQQIEQNKKDRNKESYKGLAQPEINVKERKRLSSILDKQQHAYKTIDNAKKEAGITKKDEISHLLNRKG